MAVLRSCRWSRSRPRSRRPASLLVSQDDMVWLNFLNQWITMKRSSEFFEGLHRRWLQ